ERLARVTRHQEEKPQPVLAVLAEAGPADRAAQLQLLAFDPGFLADLAPHAGHHVLVGFKLAAQSVVLAQMLVAGPRVAMDHQHAPPIRRKHVAERGGNGRVRHVRSVRPGGAHGSGARPAGSTATLWAGRRAIRSTPAAVIPRPHK